MKSGFAVGQYYTNEAIVRALACNAMPYLRFRRGGEIVAACLNRRTNPRAPAEIWAGRSDGPDRVGTSADWFREQCRADPDKAVPLFIKDAKARKPGLPPWEYHGRYRVAETLTDPTSWQGARGKHPSRGCSSWSACRISSG